MLDYAKTMEALEQIAPQLFVYEFDRQKIVQGVWQRIITDPHFKQKVLDATSDDWLFPEWKNNLGDVFSVADTDLPSYVVIAVDGSQIYPEREYSLACYMLHIGTVIIPYQTHSSLLSLQAKPYVFSALSEQYQHISSNDAINAQRYLYELQEAMQQAVAIRDLVSLEVPIIVLFDGTLMFWHLNTPEKVALFFDQYSAVLQYAYIHQILCCWYTSMPKSKEVMQLIKGALCDFDTGHADLYTCINTCTDTYIMQTVLLANQYSTLFTSTNPLVYAYPASLRPTYTYMNNGCEVARLEFPRWIADDQHCTEILVKAVFDQCHKGHGYPVALAEAHEQAVIKKVDQDRWYEMIDLLAIRYNTYTNRSIKSIKKRYPNI